MMRPLHASLIVLAAALASGAAQAQSPRPRQPLGPGLMQYGDHGYYDMEPGALQKTPYYGESPGGGYMAVYPKNLGDGLHDSPYLVPRPFVVDPGNVAISNYGTKTLTFSYWDGESAWATVQLNPGATTQVACAKCGQTVTISFHDGKQTRQVEGTKGKQYVLYWNAAQQAWDFKPQSEGAVAGTK
jgi:hypothetical protein